MDKKTTMGRFQVAFPLDADKRELRKFSSGVYSWAEDRIQEIEIQQVADIFRELSTDNLNILSCKANDDGALNIIRAINSEIKRRMDRADSIL